MSVSFNTDDVVITISNAGSGKTTALMEELAEMLKVYRPEEIAFTTFTRKGVLTGIERALHANPSLSADSFPYFQTLHKMCFKETGLKRENIIERKDLRRFNQLLGFSVSSSVAFDTQTEDDKILQRYDAIRSGADRSVFTETPYNEEKYFRLVTAYEKFKKENKLVDFYDCLLRYRETGKPLPVACFLLDEAQDITPLQWEVVQIASRNAEKIRIAGDPQQSIFSFQGSRPEVLISLAKKYKTVEKRKTYRLPKKLCFLADCIVDLMKTKLPVKHLAARENEGSVQEIADRQMLTRLIKKDFERTGFQERRWFLLFRTNFHIVSMSELFDQLVIPYHTAQGFCLSEKCLWRIERFYKYRTEGYSTPERKEAFKNKYNIEDFDDDFTKTTLVPSERRYVYLDFIEKYGIDELKRMATAPPFCFLSTTYRVKGGEADNVVVFLDGTRQVAQNALVDMDSELRVLYVACTRAREKT